MSEFVAVTNVEDVGHYTTCHAFKNEPHTLDSAFKIWMDEMAEEIGFSGDLGRIRMQESVSHIDGMNFVGRVSFSFGENYDHCMVVFVILNPRSKAG